MSSLKIIFAGPPAFAEKSLNALIADGHNIIAVYTQPDKPAGRGKKVTKSPVKCCAEQHEIPVYQPRSLRDPQAQQVLADLKPDLMIVAAYGLILPQAILDIPSKGCINIHGSLLPRWRGAAPIQHAILAGDQTTGITIMQMDAGLDTGDMLLKESLPIMSDDTMGSLHDKLAALGAKLIVASLARLDELKPVKQNDSESCYAPKIEKSQANIDWQTSAENIVSTIRAYHPWPVAYTYLDHIMVKIHQASVSTQTATAAAGVLQAITKEHLIVATGDGCLEIQALQLPGKKAMSVKAILNAYRDKFEIGKPFLCQ